MGNLNLHKREDYIADIKRQFAEVDDQFSSAEMCVPAVRWIQLYVRNFQEDMRKQLEDLMSHDQSLVTKGNIAACTAILTAIDCQLEEKRKNEKGKRNV